MSLSPEKEHNELPLLMLVFGGEGSNEGTLVYDVPDPVDLARVVLHDGPFSGGASVELR